MSGRSKIPWRRWLRALHRDIGYLAVGLTIVYALSGLALNHIEDWDPNFTSIEGRMTLEEAVTAQLPSGPLDNMAAQAAAHTVLEGLNRRDQILDVYSIEAGKLEITLKNTTLFVELGTGRVREEGQKARFLLRAANWLHLNRGKRAWTWIADGYAVFLLYLAASGLFMLPGRRGILGRAGLLALLGAAVPILYVSLSNGP